MSYKINATLSKENILSKVGSYRIFKRYCNNFIKPDKAFKSPFREDKHPSAFITGYNGDFLFKDFGGESLRAIDFVSKLYNLSFRETLEKINIDFGLGLDGRTGEVYVEDIKDLVYIEKEKTVIKVKRRAWEQKDIDFWMSFGISVYILELFNVYPISHFSINGYVIIAADLSYSFDYYWEDNIFRRKIYQPLSKDKWYSNGGDIVQGEGMLPKSGELLIITSSLKDVMTLYSLGYTAIAPTSEVSFVPDAYIKKQNKRFKRIVLFMDSDETGIKRNKELSEKWNLEYIYIPKEYDKKDISDYNRYYLSSKKLLENNKLILDTKGLLNELLT